MTGSKTFDILKIIFYSGTVNSTVTRLGIAVYMNENNLIYFISTKKEHSRIIFNIC
jgi:hypothetical protein